MGKRLKKNFNLAFIAFLAWMGGLLTLVALLN